MKNFLSGIPVPADVAVLVVSSFITLLALFRALLPFEVRKRKKSIGWGQRTGMLTLAVTGLGVIAASVAGLPSSGQQISSQAVTTRFVDPAPPPAGNPPPEVSCRLVITVQAVIPPGDVLALATQQLGVDRIYFESDDQRVGDGWSGTVTLGNARSVGSLFKVYAIAMPKDWEDYLVKAVNWLHPDNTYWAQSEWPPRTRPAQFLTIRQKDANC